jgi:hypothetical protein
MSIGKLLANLNIGFPSHFEYSGFGTNAGMAFKTPEEFFLAHAPVEVPEVFDPTSYVKSAPGSPRECTGQMRSP